MFTNPNLCRPGQLAAAAAVALIVPFVVLRPGPSETHSPSASSLPEAAPVALDPEARQVGADESWWRQASAEIERQEYAPLPVPGGLQAPNRAHDLRTTFGARGIEVVPRTGKGAAPAWRFRIGYETLTPRLQVGKSRPNTAELASA